MLQLALLLCLSLALGLVGGTFLAMLIDGPTSRRPVVAGVAGLVAGLAVAVASFVVLVWLWVAF